MNSMILHELFFDGLGEQSQPAPQLRDALARDLIEWRWRAEFIAMGQGPGGGRIPDGCCSRGGRATASSSISGPPIIATHWQAEPRSSCSMSTSTPYHMDFGAKAATYVDTFMEVICWQNVDRISSAHHRAGQGVAAGAGP